MEAPSKAFLLFFLLPDWLKLNHLKKTSDRLYNFSILFVAFMEAPSKAFLLFFLLPDWPKLNRLKKTSDRLYNFSILFVAFMEAPSKAFLLFFLLPDWLKLNRLKKTSYRLYNFSILFVAFMEAPSKAFLLFFLLPDWLKLNHFKSRMECGSSDNFFEPYLFHRSRNNRRDKLRSKFWREHIWSCWDDSRSMEPTIMEKTPLWSVVANILGNCWSEMWIILGSILRKKRLCLDNLDWSWNFTCF